MRLIAAVAFLLLVPTVQADDKIIKRLFKFYDKNKDGVLSRGESNRARLSRRRLDRNNDGKITLAEFIAGQKDSAKRKTRVRPYFPDAQVKVTRVAKSLPGPGPFCIHPRTLDKIVLATKTGTLIRVFDDGTYDKLITGIAVSGGRVRDIALHGGELLVPVSNNNKVPVVHVMKLPNEASTKPRTLSQATKQLLKADPFEGQPATQIRNVGFDQQRIFALCQGRRSAWFAMATHKNGKWSDLTPIKGQPGIPIEARMFQLIRYGKGVSLITLMKRRTGFQFMSTSVTDRRGVRHATRPIVLPKGTVLAFGIRVTDRHSLDWDCTYTVQRVKHKWTLSRSVTTNALSEKLLNLEFRPTSYAFGPDGAIYYASRKAGTIHRVLISELESLKRKRPQIPSQFRRLDKNSDGKLTADEIHWPYFHKYDTNGDKQLSMKELGLQR